MDQPHQPDDRSAPEAPVLSLQEARERREARRERERQRQRGRQAGIRHAHEWRALVEAIKADRMDWIDLKHMVRLGIVTGEEEKPPCLDQHRETHYFDWLDVTYPSPDQEQDQAPPDLESHRPDDLKQWQRERARTPSRVSCPLLAWAFAGKSPPCVEALRMRANDTWWDAEQKRRREYGLDEADPIVQLEVRPCVVLGREAFRGIMRTVWEEKPLDDP